MIADEKKSKKPGSCWFCTYLITMLTWAAELSCPGVEDTSASCMTDKFGKASI